MKNYENLDAKIEAINNFMSNYLMEHRNISNDVDITYLQKTLHSVIGERPTVQLEWQKTCMVTESKNNILKNNDVLDKILVHFTYEDEVDGVKISRPMTLPYRTLDI